MTHSAALEAAWIEHLACPACAGTLTAEPPGAATHLACAACSVRYPVRDGIPSFVEPDKSEQAAEIAQRDHEASAYEGLFLSWESFLEVAPLVRDLKPARDHHVLEVGAGTGRVVREYIRNVERVVAIDFSFESLRHIRHSLGLLPEVQPRLIPVHADACALPVKPASFDRVISAGMLQHLPSAAHRARAIEGMGRALKPGGRFVLQARHWSQAHSFYEGRRGNKVVGALANFLVGNSSGGIGLERTNQYADGTVSLYNTEGAELRELVEQAGIRVERVVGRIHNIKGMQRLGTVRPLVERVLERTPLSLLASQEVVAVGTRA
ncbi:MAG: methyltransferase domain-containing protein [Polyangiaceae bacterium]